MAKNFAEITFTDSVKKAQEKYGSREVYAKVEKRLPEQKDLYLREMTHIERMDGFYMSSVGENGWPYVQFRGGPKGFLKVIDQNTLGYADFKGNLQYISTGNITSTKKVALILLHYPTKTRLKIWANAEILDPKENPELTAKLVDEEYQATVERLVIFKIEAYDWNCPQHITPRYTLEEIKQLMHQHPELAEDLCPSRSLKE
ncbi:MAG: pyridoxamine 5'-phosphate oxidase family protein [bacterium]|nr:pyridoxamine 5'-phosphate oxidase family protein [bacterium]